MRDAIIELIRRNRISTTEVADALGKSGVMAGMRPVTPDLHCVGVGRAVFAAHESNYAVHEQVRDVQKGEVPVVVAHDCGERAIFGDLVAKFLLLYRGADAIVVDGLMRDSARLRRERMAVWCRGHTPLGCFNRPADPFPGDVAERYRAQIDGGIVVCDDAGVVIIPASKVNQKTHERLEYVEAQEDIWFFCLDTLKWDTKMIVCDKAYLDAEHAHRIPEELRVRLADFDADRRGNE